jgi:crotonobetainyl-CoA:carnitine CoA-transferase CaiB-like acyl-CoA transferase
VTTAATKHPPCSARLPKGAARALSTRPGSTFPEPAGREDPLDVWEWSARLLPAIGPGEGEQMTNLRDVRVVEIADERAEYCGLLLMGLGAEVVKVEPPDGGPTRRIGPFYSADPGPEGSLHFWQYNRGKRSVIIDLEQSSAADELSALLVDADVLLTTTPKDGFSALGLSESELRDRFPALIIARMSDFGDDGPWSGYKGSDLVHLALGGQAMNCGYDPLPESTYDLPPIAPQMWHSAHVAGELLAMGIVAALIHQHRTGEGQYVSCSIHEAMAKNTEIDLMSWIMRRAPVHRQTCRHATESISRIQSIANTKDGRWIMAFPSARAGEGGVKETAEFLRNHGQAGWIDSRPDMKGAGIDGGRNIPGTAPDNESDLQLMEAMQRVIRMHTFGSAPWQDAQEHGLMWVPLRRPEENIADEHWRTRRTFDEIFHPRYARNFTYAVSKWVSNEAPWETGSPAPSLGQHQSDLARPRAPRTRTSRLVRKGDSDSPPTLSKWGKPFPLQGVRILDFT